MRALRFGKVRKLHSSVLRESKTACDQRPSWIPVAPAAPRYFYKVRRLASEKTIQNQPLTSSVLNPLSRKLWRQTASERKFRASARRAAVQSFARERRVFIGDFCTLASRQRIFGAGRLAEGDEPESNILRVVENQRRAHNRVNYNECDCCTARAPFPRHLPRAGPIVNTSKTANARVVAIRRTRDAKLSAPQLPLPRCH
jgi:hypothetical protein